jgi:hypothetical protein
VPAWTSFYTSTHSQPVSASSTEHLRRVLLHPQSRQTNAWSSLE